MNFTGSALFNAKSSVELINNRFICNDFEIRESIRLVLKEFDIQNVYINRLNEILKVTF